MKNVLTMYAENVIAGVPLKSAITVLNIVIIIVQDHPIKRHILLVGDMEIVVLDGGNKDCIGEKP